MSHKTLIHIPEINKKELIESILVTLFISLLALHGYAGYEHFVNKDGKKHLFSLEKETTTIEVKTKEATTTIPILVYHHIRKGTLLSRSGDYSPANNFNVDPSVFESQMKMIRERKYTPLTIDELLFAQKNNLLPEKPIVITLDDGWRSQYESAFPILLQYKIPATFYIYTDVIGAPLFMTWKQLQTLVDNHMEIGGHTTHHAHLTKIADSSFYNELVYSKKILEKHLNIEVHNLAYPYGQYDDHVIEETKKAGYISGRTSKRSTYNDFSDLYQLRVLYAPNSLTGLENMLSGT